MNVIDMGEDEIGAANLIMIRAKWTILMRKPAQNVNINNNMPSS